MKPYIIYVKVIFSKGVQTLENEAKVVRKIPACCICVQFGSKKFKLQHNNRQYNTENVTCADKSGKISARWDGTVGSKPYLCYVLVVWTI